MGDFDITEYDILEQIWETPAGPVKRIQKRDSEELLLAFFLERNYDYPEFQEQVNRLITLGPLPNVLNVICLSRPDESRGLPPAVITENAAECYGSFFYNPKPRLTKLETGILFFGLANAVRECNTHQILVAELSPNTIFLTSEIHAKLANPGIKAFADPNRIESDDVHVQLFVPPELWSGGRLTIKGCFYSYGMLLFWVFARDVVFQKTHAGTAFKDNILADVRPIMPPRISPMAKTIISACWSTDPDERPTASEIMKSMMKNVDFFFSMSHADAKKLLAYQRGLIDDVVSRPLPPIPPADRHSNGAIMRKNSTTVRPKEVVKGVPMQRSQSDTRLTNMDLVPLVPGLKEKGKVYATTVARFQKFLMQIRKSNKDETIKMLMSITPKDDPTLIARNLFLAAQCLYMELPTLAELTKAYVAASTKKNKFGLLKQELLRLTYENLILGEPFPKDLPRVAFLFHCMNEHVFSPSEMIDFIGTFYTERLQTRKKALCVLFAWFAPEIEELDSTLFANMMDVAKQVESFVNLHPGYANFLSELDVFRKDNWAKLKLRRVDHAEPKQFVAYILRHDEANNLKLAMDRGNIVTKRIAPDIHVPCIHVQDRPSLLMYAAAFQAVNCYQYLSMIKGGTWLAKDEKYRNLSSFAVAGGNMTVVRFVQNLSDAFDSGLQVAASCHMTAIFAHLVKSSCADLEIPDKNGKKVITTAAAANNISTVLYCLSKKVSISTHETFGVCFTFIGLLFTVPLNVECLTSYTF